MEWLNYHHLLYFWTVAREGSVTRASQQLRLAQPTVSGQLKALEEALGEKLFERTGRRLVLTDVGRVVFRYADEIFSLGRELQDTLKGRPTGRPVRFTVGVADAVPKLVAYRLLLPALSLPEPVHVVCREDKPERLIAELAAHSLDLVISDGPLGAGAKVKAYSHLLVVGEIEDGALLKTFGQAGLGLFPAPLAIEAEVRAQFGVKLVGRLDAVRERFYALSVERKIKHPAVLAISEAARRKLFG